MKTWTPIYNEMPWTPFFLRHLLNFDCEIHIGEGASEYRHNDSDRSTDGSWELINFFANRWKDRVTVYPFDYNLNQHGANRKTRTLPRETVKKQVWDSASKGEWIIGLSPDNFYTTQDIKKIKETCQNAKKDDYLLMTGMRVFAFNFRTVVTKTQPAICGAWVNLWPAIWRKNNECPLTIGDELLKHKGTGQYLAPPSIQDSLIKHKHIIINKDINQFHYKSVKKYTNRIQRYESQRVANIYMSHPVDHPNFVNYDGNHPDILDKHPWRHTKDCRKENFEFNWQDFVDIVTKP